ncbi:MAG: hypothetical protein NC453_30075, partial [Muribaculum sp.]|nr:hypothetical protein [Muribaculum sp.]
MILKYSLRITFICVTICSILSQLPGVPQTAVGQVLKITWIVPFCINLITNPHSFIKKPLRSYYLFIVVFVIYCFFATIFTNNEYFGTDLNNMLISLMVFAVSFATWLNSGNQRFLNLVSLSSLVTTFIVAIIIYRDFLAASSISELYYNYASKNSAAQIMLNAVIFAYCYKPNKTWKYSIPMLVSTFMIAEVFLLQSRASMVCLAFVLLYFL